MTVEIRRGTDRFVEREPGRRTKHAFSFGSHYDPERLELGPMVCHDDHLLGAGRGFDAHRHSDLLVVSWVVSGSLVHGGTATGEPVTLPAGSVAVLATGPDGVEHSEHAGPGEPCRFVQVWLRPGEDAGVLAAPGSYEHDVPELAANRPTPVARPRADAKLSVVRLDGTPGVTVELPTAPLVHVFVATGALLRSSLAEPLSAGDAFVMTDEPAHVVAAGVPTDLLVWTFDPAHSGA